MVSYRITCFLLLFTITLHAQSVTAYQSLIARAGLFHLQKRPVEAIALYKQAFALQQPDALNAYKAASVYALDSNVTAALQYLELALKNGWTEADWLAGDPYFDYLRTHATDSWKKIAAAAFAAEKEYEKSLRLPQLRKQINSMMLEDQQLRYRQAQPTTTKEERATISRQINEAAIVHKTTALKIITRYGWPAISAVGKDGQNNLWLLVQHADDDVLFQQQALAAMKKYLGTAELNAENYAFLYDRIQCNLNYKQYYGTQVNWTHHGQASGFRPILQENRVDARRKQLGMQPLAIYALTYGFSYAPVSATVAGKQERSDSLYTRALMDTALQFYRLKKYEQLYDYYNTASTIAGGMNQADNLAAAVVFARVALVTGEQRYKDIALDFLNLLYVRRQLTAKKMLRQPAFKILYPEQRWKEMLGRLSHK